MRSVDDQRRALADPDRVRPDACPRCHVHGLHVHERRSRVLAGEVEGPGWIEILIFRCAGKKCRAVWRLLPQFLARHLWRRWTLVGISLSTDEPRRHKVPARTRRRWRTRLASSAAVLIALLGHSGVASVVARVKSAGHAATLSELVEAFGGLAQLSALAEFIHRQEPGVRLM